VYRLKSSNGTSRFLTLVFASIVLFSSGILVQNVFADSGNNTVSVMNGTSTQSVTSQLTVNSQDNNGNPITGYFTTLSQNGNQIAMGFTPAIFTLNDSQTYTVQVGSFGNFMFDHWLDTGSANVTRDVSITSNSTITAVYKTVPQPPTGLIASAVSSSQINLSWTAPSDDGGSAISGYMIERSTDGGSTWSTVQSNTGSTATTYSDTGLPHSTTYTYRASAINSVGPSQPSNTASATTFNTVPTPPTGLTATAQVLNVNLSWNVPSDNGGTPITGYMIERSTDNGSTWSTLVANTGSTGTTYSDTNVLPLSTYTYRVSAINDIGTGNPSNTASASTPSVSVPSTPTLP